MRDQPARVCLEPFETLECHKTYSHKKRVLDGLQECGSQRRMQGAAVHIKAISARLWTMMCSKRPTRVITYRIELLAKRLKGNLGLIRGMDSASCGWLRTSIGISVNLRAIAMSQPFALTASSMEIRECHPLRKIPVQMFSCQACRRLEDSQSRCGN